MRKILPLLALAVVCVSCDAPFDLSLSRAAAVLPKMTHQGTVGPFSDFGGGEQEMEFSFLPAKTNSLPGIDFASGFLVMRSPTRTLARYARNGATGTFGSWGTDYINPVPAYEPYLFEPMKFMDTLASPLAIFGMDPLDPTRNSISAMNADFVSQSLSYPPGWVPPSEWKNLHDNFINVNPPIYDADVLGFSIYPTDFGQPWDDTYWLIRMRGTGALMEVTMRLDAVSLNKLYNKQITKPGLIPFDVTSLAGVKRCRYFFDPDPVRGPSLDQMKSYVSWYDSAGGWKCISWKGLATVESAILPGVTRRIDALLTTGRLLSTQDGIGRLYDSNGNEIAAFPLGGLHFIGERYVNGVPLVLFSLARLVSENYSRSLSVDIYSITAADLERL